MRRAAPLFVKALVALTLVPLALAGCASRGSAVQERRVEKPRPPGLAQGWRAVATPYDRSRLRDWRTAWVEALRRAQAAGHGAAIAREGALLLPDAALPAVALSDGNYACRVVKMGAKGAGELHYMAYPTFDCRVDREAGIQHLAKVTGSQRPTGHLYPESDRRSVFLGTMVLSDERMAMKYGQDRDRDLAGFVERVGPRRWRMVLPYPRFESILDVVELIPRSGRS